MEHVENASVHGLSDVLRLNSTLKIIWLVVLGGVFCGGYFHCWNLILDATGEEIITYVENFRDNGGFPPITVCPTHMKYDREKTTKMMYGTTRGTSGSPNFEPYIFNYLTSLETMSYYKAIYAQHYPRWDYYNTIRDDVYDVLIGNSSYTQLEMDLTLDFDDVVIEIPGYPIINKRKIMSVQGACYSFEIFAPVPLSLSNIYSVQLALKRDFENAVYDHERAPGIFFTYNSDLVFFGQSSFWPKSPPEYVFQSEEYITVNEGTDGALFRINEGIWALSVKIDYVFDLLISSATVSRVNRRSTPCRDWSEQDQSICLVQCYNDEFCSKLPIPCLLFHPNQTSEQQYKRLCSMLDDKEMFYLTQKTAHCAMQPEISAGESAPVNKLCELRCPARCFEEVYYVTHSRNERRIYRPDDPGYRDLHWANLTVRYQDFNRRLVVHEHLTWKADTFIASYASAMSLWTGVSGVAFAQLSIILFQVVSNGFKHIQRSKKNLAGLTVIVFLLLLGLAVLLILTLVKLRGADTTPPVVDLSSDNDWDVPGSRFQSSWKYQGCFGNPKGNLLRGLLDFDSKYFTIPALYYQKDRTANWESVDHCLSVCAHFVFAGVQDGVACMCGDFIHADVSLEELRLPEDQCNLPCNPIVSPSRCEHAECPTRCGEAQCCGGQGKIDLYKVEGKEYTKKGFFLGCFQRQTFWSNYQHALLLLDKTNAGGSAELPEGNVNLNTCADFCKGYQLMGVVGGRCTCSLSDNVPAFVDIERINRYGCDERCPNAADISNCESLGCEAADEYNSGQQKCGDIWQTFDFRTSIYVLHSCTTVVENAEPSRISAWVNEPSDPVHCKEGYSLTGPQILHCNASKMWQETTMPTCI